LIETFNLFDVRTITYQDEIELSANRYLYEDLPDSIIDEIFEIIQEYDVLMKKV